MVKNADRRAVSVDKILNAAIDVLQGGGFAAFRVADVATRSGISHGLLFRYYPTKQDLVRAAFELSNDRTIQMATQAGEQLKPHSPDLKVLLHGLLWIMMQRDQWVYELILATRYDTELRIKVADVYQKHLDDLDRVSREFSERTGILPIEDADIAIRMIGWGFQGVVMNEHALGENIAERDRIVAWYEKVAAATYSKPPQP
jgi:AcrR family transcriptional regulator